MKKAKASRADTARRKPQTKLGKYSGRISNKEAGGLHAEFRTSEEFFRQILDSLEDYALFTTDIRGNISSWNSGAERMFGYSEKDIIGKPCDILFTPEDRAAQKPEHELQAAVDKGKGNDNKWHVRKDGSRFWASGLVFPLRDQAGVVRGFTKIARDLTRQRQAKAQEKELLSERQRLYELFMQAPAMIALTKGPDFKYEFANPLYLKLLGKTDDIIGKTVMEVFPELEGQGILTILSRVYRTGKPYVGTEELVKLDINNDGKPEDVYFNFVYLPSRNTDGKVVGIMTHAVDVTSHVVARQKVKDSEDQFRQLLNSTGEGIFGVDMEGRCTFVNPAALKMFGFKDVQAITGKTIHNLIHYKRADGSPYPVEECIAYQNYTKGEPVHLDSETLWRADGSKFLAEYRAMPIVKNKKVVGGVITISDVTRRKELERQKDEFLGIASHELKTPVTSIKAYGQVLEVMFRRKGEVKAAEQLQKMDAQVDKLTNLIGDLLDVTKIHSGRLQFQEEYFDFNSLINEVVEEIQRTSIRHKIVKELAPSRKVYGDRDRIGQVLTNLITNAIKYSPHADKIIVHTSVDKRSVTLCVEDFGVGIPKAKQGRVFEQFFRVSGPRQNTFPGLGLGLYISSEIIKREGGKIWVNSILGKGSTFCFSLPFGRKRKVKQQLNDLADEEVKHE